MRRLVSGGQAVLCTIHQPSAVLFNSFDSLLLLAKGGHMAYFGESESGFLSVRSSRDSRGSKTDTVNN